MIQFADAGDRLCLLFALMLRDNDPDLAAHLLRCMSSQLRTREILAVQPSWCGYQFDDAGVCCLEPGHESPHMNTIDRLADDHLEGLR